MNSVKFTVPGNPMSKGRPRFYNGHAITDKNTANYENLVKLIIMQHGFAKLEGYLEATIYAHFPIPKSASKKKKEEMVSGTIRPLIRDVDNVAKIILDSCNKVLYDDDRQVVRLYIEKYYSEQPRVEVMIKEIN